MIGRVKETEDLERMYASSESEFVAVYGRRRVGKTYLVRETFDGRMTFQHSGLAKGGMCKQLRHFHDSLVKQGFSGARPSDWFEAFGQLEELVGKSERKRKVVFIDEMPWMDTPRSDFVSALESFWNGWASARKDVLLIVCGSAASWLVKNLFRNHGGLHNRVTWRIHLMPFTLKECERFVQDRGIVLSRREIAECYMALGGIPYYWRYLDRRYGLDRNFDQMFFAENAPLRNEFGELYASLFRNAGGYMKVVSALAKKKIGMNMSELTAALKIKANGTLTKQLATLENCGFIRSYRSFGSRKKNTVYQLIDNFTLFHFRFLENPSRDPNFWSSTSRSPAQQVWRGLAFERLCLQHVAQIREKLRIGGVHTEVYAWSHAGDDIYPRGTQIDLVLERDDGIINLCEMKFADGLYALDKDEMDKLEYRRTAFRGITGTRRAVHLTLVTSGGLVDNAYRNSIQSEVALDDLFNT